MKLQEKLKKEGFSNCDYLEKIADKHAIDFADWLDTEDAQQLILDLKTVGELPKIPKTKELLQIFKKEKGL